MFDDNSNNKFQWKYLSQYLSLTYILVILKYLIRKPEEQTKCVFVAWSHKCRCPSIISYCGGYHLSFVSDTA